MKKRIISNISNNLSSHPWMCTGRCKLSKTTRVDRKRHKNSKLAKEHWI